MIELNRARQLGHVSTEWVFVTVAVVFLLFAPMPGSDQSVVAMTMEAIKNFHANSSFLLSLP